MLGSWSEPAIRQKETKKERKEASAARLLWGRACESKERGGEEEVKRGGAVDGVYA
jgi:hypothetical protein